MAGYDTRKLYPVPHVLACAKNQIVPAMMAKAPDVAPLFESLLDEAISKNVSPSRMMKVPEISSFTEMVEVILAWIKDNVSREKIATTLMKVETGIKTLMGDTNFKSSLMRFA
jgi:hypothetical protein